MSVIKNKRGLSDLEFFHNAIKLRKRMTELLLRDFGIKQKNTDVNVFAKEYAMDKADKSLFNELCEKYKITTLVESYPRWLINEFRESILINLREHPYCGMYIPQDTLHREIHSKVHDIPTPCGKACRVAVEAIDSWLAGGLISLDDPLERRIEVISWCFKAKYKPITAMLEYQREVVIEFKKRH